MTAVSRAAAADAVAAAELEIARRGLVATVTGLFYQALAADHKVAVARRAAGEAASFTNLDPTAGERPRRSACRCGEGAATATAARSRPWPTPCSRQQKSHLDLAVLLFPDPRTAYTLAPGPVVPLPDRADVDEAAMRLNPELHQALASLRVSTLDVTAARAAYLPDLGLNFTYGIDAVQFAVNGRDGVKNLGYSASATLDIPGVGLALHPAPRSPERDPAGRRTHRAHRDPAPADCPAGRVLCRGRHGAGPTSVARPKRANRERESAPHSSALYRGRGDGTRGGRRAKLLDCSRNRTRGRYHPLPMALTNLQLLTGAI